MKLNRSFISICYIFILNLALLNPVVAASLSLTNSSFEHLPAWQAGGQALSLKAFQQSCHSLLKKDPQSYLGNHARFGRLATWQTICEMALQIKHPNDTNARTFFQNWFHPMQVTHGWEKTGLFTGYYIPLVEGSLTQQKGYPVPLYGTPNDLVTLKRGGTTVYGRYEKGQFVPYPTRAEINQGALKNRGLEIVWLKNKAERFFLQVQGSGEVKLPNGHTLQVAYASRNGHAYTPIGRVLVNIGQLSLSEVSLTTIKNWLLKHPHLEAAILDQNASFIFFHIKSDGRSPVGAANVPLTPARSLAVDPSYIPYGVPIWLSTQIPKKGKQRDDEASQQPFNALMIAQDKGSAIKGPIRGDVYWGLGSNAEYIAGHMKSQGQYWVLIPNDIG